MLLFGGSDAIPPINKNIRKQAWRDEHLSLTVSSNEAARLYDAVLRQLVSWADCEQLGGVETSTKRMLDAEPNFGRFY